MSRACVLITLALIAIAQSPAGWAAASQPPVTLVELNEGYGPPDGVVTLPVDLRTPDGVQVGEIELRLTIPSTKLAFERAVLSGISEAAGVRLTAQAEPENGAGVSLRLVIQGRQEGGSRQPLPTGQVAHLVFKLADTAEPNSEVPLAPKVVAQTTASPPAIVEPLTSPASRIVVTSPTVISCFFYMH